MNEIDNEKHWMQRFSLCLERNIRGVQYGVYGVAFVGLAIALRSVRPFKKFTSPSEIPASFVEKHLTLHGKVICIDTPLGTAPPILMIDHQPILASRWRKSNGRYLPVQVSSVDILNNGVSWLQTIVSGSNAKFTILKTTPQAVSCIVKSDATRRDVGVDLVSLGFASVSAIDFDLEKDPVYLKYYKKLLDAENRAEKRGLGMWGPKEVSWISRQWRKVGELLSLPHIWQKLKHESITSNSIKMAKL